MQRRKFIIPDIQPSDVNGKSNQHCGTQILTTTATATATNRRIIPTPNKHHTGMPPLSSPNDSDNDDGCVCVVDGSINSPVWKYTFKVKRILALFTTTSHTNKY